MSANDGEQVGDSFQGFAPSGSTLCPECRYDLVGLPTEHYCPECGSPYDRDTYFFHSILPRWPLGVFIFMVVAPLISYIGWSVLTGFPLFPPLITILTAMLIWQILLFRRMGRLYLALTPKKIIALTPNGFRRKELSWKKLKPLDMDRKQNGLYLLAANIHSNLGVTIDMRPFAKSRADILKLFELIERLRKKRTELNVSDGE